MTSVKRRRDRVDILEIRFFVVLFFFLHYMRDRPFNLKWGGGGWGGGGGLWFFASLRIFFSDNTRVRIFFL